MNHVVSKMVARAQILWATRDLGATAVEYAMLVAFVAFVLVAVVTTLGWKTHNAFLPVTNTLP